MARRGREREQKLAGSHQSLSCCQNTDVLACDGTHMHTHTHTHTHTATRAHGVLEIGVGRELRCYKGEPNAE